MPVDPRAALRRGRMWCGLIVVGLCIAGCDALTKDDGAGTPNVFARVRDVDLRAHFPRPTEAGAPPRERAPRAQSYFGDEGPPVERAEAAPSGEGYELNFENAPIASVAKVIIGDILGVGYTIDSRIQGTVTLTSGRAIPKSDIVYVLENALRLSNVVLVKDAAGYRLIPAGEAVGSGRMDNLASGSTQPGYGTTVMPLRYVSVQTIVRLLDSFVTKPGMIRADPGRNLIFLQGTGAERQQTADTILSFDVDWMRGESVGIYPVRKTTPEPIITELERIMETGEGGLNQNLVKFQPIGRLNAILVVTRRQDLLRRAALWITRLDNTDNSSNGVKVYRVRYGDAKQMAAVLNDIFLGQSSSATESAASQIAPGAGVSSLSSPARTSLLGAQPGATTPQSAQKSDLAPPGASPASGISGSAGVGSNIGFGQSGGGATLTGVRITADTANNSLLIYANQQNYRIIEQTLREIDRPQLQVAIDLTIAEITLNNKLNYGVQYFLKSGDLGMAPDKGSVGLVNSATSALLGRALPGFNFLVGPEGDPRVILDALRGVTAVKVLSAPSIVVLDNQTATLQVGDQVPITTGTAVSVTAPGAPVVNSISYRNTGVILRVAPRVNVNGNVLLNIEQEISNVSDASNPNTLTPTVSQREVKSAIAVASGQTVLLGGLISERQERSRSGIPFLEKLDVIGDAFSHTSTTTDRTELIIFIRPQIIRNGGDAQRIAEELRAKMQGSVESAVTTYPVKGARPAIR